MAAITVTFTDKVATRLDPDSPLTTGLFNDLWDNTTFLREWLGETFKAGAVQDHDHDGANSALIEVGGNRLRNGSFEQGEAGWTIVDFTGGTHAIETANDIHGAQTLSFNSTVLANGGGDALNNEFITVADVENYHWRVMVKASAANVSSKAEIVWYDDAQAQISVTQLYQDTSTPTAETLKSGTVVPPANARFVKIRITGGVPGIGTAVGTIYFDGAGFGDATQSTVARLRLKTATASLAGSLAGVSTALITLNGYAFFPMIHAVEGGIGENFVAPHPTDGASPDAPRFALYRNTTGAATWDVDYRYLDAD